MRLYLLVVALGVASAVPRVRRQAGQDTPCNGGYGVCVPYYLCRDGTVITDGAGLIDIRIGPASTNSSDTRAGADVISECPNFLDVCCDAGFVIDPEPPTPTPYTARCGRRNEEGVNVRITGFKENQAQFGEFPWMAAVLNKQYVEESQSEVNLYACGGSLIHPQVVLTAAHCVFDLDPSAILVRLGEWDTQKAYELYPHQDRGVSYVKLHETFNPNNLHDDFALLFLDSPVELAPNVDTICLPAINDVLPIPTYCWATGWGKDRFGKEGLFQNVLKEIELPLVDRHSCQASLRTTRLGRHFLLDESFTCAGGEAGLDTCTGDGGSPLVCQLDSRTYVQQGIVAWGIGCGEGGVPGVYADVRYAVDWIVYNVDNILFNEFNVDNTNYWS